MGFDIECIPNIEMFMGEFFCAVCRFLVYPNEALRSMCDHLYCPPCLAYVISTTMACPSPYDGYLVTETDTKPLVESNKMLADALGEIVVFCSYQKSGCTWIGFLSQIPSHCLSCAFRTSLVVCTVCEIQIQHHQAEEHAQICHGIQQGQFEMSPHGRFVAVATPVPEQQQYQPPYYYMHQPQDVPTAIPLQQLHQPEDVPTAIPLQKLHQPEDVPTAIPLQQLHQLQDVPMAIPLQHLHSPSQQQVPYVQPASQYVAQTQSHVQAQPQLQSQSSALHEPHAVFPSAPVSLHQAYLSAPRHLLDLSQTFSPSQGHQNLQAQAHSKTTPLSQAHDLQNHQGPQYQTTSLQLYKPKPMHPQANTAQRSLPYNTIGQSQSHQPHAYPQANQTDQARASPDNMNVYHQVRTQTQHPSQSPRDQNSTQLVRQYGGVTLTGSSVLRPSRQQTSAPTSNITMESHDSHLRPMQGLQTHPQTFQVHHAFPGGSGQAAPSFQATKHSDMDVTQNHTGDEATNGEKGAVEIATANSNHELKGKSIDACAASDDGPNKFMERNEIKIEPEENVVNRRANLGKSPTIEDKGVETAYPSLLGIGTDYPSLLGIGTAYPSMLGTGTDYPSLLGTGTDYPSLFGTPVDHNAPLGPGEGRYLEYVVDYFNRNSHTYSDNGQKPRAYSPRSLDTGFDQRSLVMPHEKHVPKDPDHMRGGKMKEGVGFDSNALLPRNVGFMDRYTYHGLPGDGGSFSGDMEPFPNSRKRAAGPDEGEGLHSQITKEDQQNNQNAKKPKTAHENTSPSPSTIPKLEESGSGDLGQKEEN